MADVEKPSVKQRTASAIAAACLVCAPLTASFEGLRTHPYRDPAPKHTMTVCYGETNVPMRVYSRDECGALLRQNLGKVYAAAIAQCLPQLVVPEHKYMFAALIDAAYNAGQGNVCRKSPMAARIRAGQWGRVCRSFIGWHTLPGTPAHNGLTRRRNTEASLCSKD